MKLYNTFTNQKEEFKPVEEGKVKFYVCGPTVYNYIHIGNARAFIVFDVLRRFFEFSGYEVNYILNLTDIDDKIINQAVTEKVDVGEITKKYSAAFFEDIKNLNIKPATHNPRATEHIEEIIALIESLVEQGFAYESKGDVLFDISKFDDYGKLSGKNLDDLRAGARVAIDEKKNNPLDFVLWKKQKPGEPAWASPWGKGRPGWHIECSAMSMKYLGDTFDIHAGGIDLAFPHHENEIAQSECASKNKFVKYWLHNGFLKIDGDKMSKSLGNFRTVKDILESYSYSAIRTFFLQKHYRSPIDLTSDGLQAAKSASIKLNIFYKNLCQAITGFESDLEIIETASFSKKDAEYLANIKQLRTEFVNALNDDMNTPTAISKLFEIVRHGNQLLTNEPFSENQKLLGKLTQKYIEDFDLVFGILDAKGKEFDSGLVGDLMEVLIEMRSDLRTKKEWALSDKIRDSLGGMGIVLEDKEGVTTWRKK